MRTDVDTTTFVFHLENQSWRWARKQQLPVASTTLSWDWAAQLPNSFPDPTAPWWPHQAASIYRGALPWAPSSLSFGSATATTKLWEEAALPQHHPHVLLAAKGGSRDAGPALSSSCCSRLEISPCSAVLKWSPLQRDHWWAEGVSRCWSSCHRLCMKLSPECSLSWGDKSQLLKLSPC